MLSNARLLSIIAGSGLIALLRSAAQAICLYRHSQFSMIGRRGWLIKIWREWQGRDPARFDFSSEVLARYGGPNTQIVFQLV
jgi:hypothetical protein